MSDDKLQLKNLTVDEARGRMLTGAARLGVEDVALADALGRVLAAPVVADRDQPPFDASAMDGWAIRRVDLAPGTQFQIAGESAAGRAHARAVEPGQAVRIFTGAPVPPGADLVVIQENATRDGDHVSFTIDREPPPGNIRAAGGAFPGHGEHRPWLQIGAADRPAVHGRGGERRLVARGVDRLGEHPPHRLGEVYRLDAQPGGVGQHSAARFLDGEVLEGRGLGHALSRQRPVQ